MAKNGDPDIVDMLDTIISRLSEEYFTYTNWYNRVLLITEYVFEDCCDNEFTEIYSKIYDTMSDEGLNEC